jgi:hypothetical protein
MRILAISGLVLGFWALAMAAAAQAANDGPWCYRDFGGPQFSNCSYYSARQCLATAGIIGGVCERNHGPVALNEKLRPKRSR